MDNKITEKHLVQGRLKNNQKYCLRLRIVNSQKQNLPEDLKENEFIRCMVLPISNLRKFLTNICYNFVFNWQTDEKNILF